MKTGKFEQLVFKVPLGLVVVLLLVGIATAGGLASWKRRPMADDQVVAAVRDLPAYTRISESDVIVLTTDDADGAAVEVDDVVGKTTVIPVSEMSALTSSPLLEIPEEWFIMAVPAAPILGLTIGQQVTLVGARNDEDDPGPFPVSDRAIVLSQQEDQIVVALPLDEASEAASFLVEYSELVVLMPLSE